MEHVVVYSERGRFGGWPANHGLWHWGNEIVVGFQSCVFKVVGDSNHAIDKTQPRTHLQARSRDGGRTWAVEEIAALQDWVAIEDKGLQAASRCKLSAQHSALTFKAHPAKDGSLWMFTSEDACRSWDGPFEVRLFDQRTIEPRIDYIVHDDTSVTAFLTAFKDNGKEGRVFCARSIDGLSSWRFLSWIGEERLGFNIMPSTVRLEDGSYLCATRWQEGDLWGIDTFRSTDDCRSWQLQGHPVQGGGLSNPPSLLRLRDGRLCLTYGYRAKPYGIRARLSIDSGTSWGDEIILRDDGGHWDLGYVRSVELPCGDVVSVYYFCHDKSAERTIEATIWRP